MLMKRSLRKSVSHRRQMRRWARKSKVVNNRDRLDSSSTSRKVLLWKSLRSLNLLLLLSMKVKKLQ